MKWSNSWNSIKIHTNARSIGRFFICRLHLTCCAHFPNEAFWDRGALLILRSLKHIRVFFFLSSHSHFCSVWSRQCDVKHSSSFFFPKWPHTHSHPQAWAFFCDECRGEGWMYICIRKTKKPRMKQNNNETKTICFKPGDSLLPKIIHVIKL